MHNKLCFIQTPWSCMTPSCFASCAHTHATHTNSDALVHMNACLLCVHTYACPLPIRTHTCLCTSHVYTLVCTSNVYKLVCVYLVYDIVHSWAYNTWLFAGSSSSFQSVNTRHNQPSSRPHQAVSCMPQKAHKQDFNSSASSIYMGCTSFFSMTISPLQYCVFSHGLSSFVILLPCLCDNLLSPSDGCFASSWSCSAAL